MKRKLSLLVVFLLAISLLNGCGNRNKQDESTIASAEAPTGTSSSAESPAKETKTQEESGTERETESVPAATEPGDIPSDTPTEAQTEATEKKEPAGDFSITTENGSKVTVSGNVYTITGEGEYALSGILTNGQIIIDAGKESVVVLDLQAASVSCDYDSPIIAKNADKVKIHSGKEYSNYIIDNRKAENTDADSSGESAAIYAKCDLSITGTGSLSVNGGFNNGIHTKKGLTIKNIDLKVTAVNNALKGNDSVTVESGSLLLISTNGDGIKTTDSDLSSKGNQRGNVTFLGGQTVIYASHDGVDASYNAVIEPEARVWIYTDDYSPYTQKTSGTETEFYIVVATSDYSDTSVYGAYFINKDNPENRSFREAKYSCVVSSGRTRYYGLKLSAPLDCNKAVFSVSYEGNEALSEEIELETSKNGFLLSELKEGKATGTLISLSLSESSSPDYSSKGIKAANGIIINGGKIEISSNDDALHSSSGANLENGETGLGNIQVNAGRLTLISKDDAIHADNVFTLADGEIHVLTSHEGIEANVLNILSGNVTVFATEDALNATNGNASPLINIEGGTIEVRTPAGDTDVIDSNGSYRQSGGLVIAKGGSSSGYITGSIDVSDTVTVKGGTVIAFGGICETPGEDSLACVVFPNKTFETGEYSFLDSSGSVIAKFSLTQEYTSLWISSEGLKVGADYRLMKDDMEYVSWSQSERFINVN